jgi:oxygen-independent coproporphyrinogen-3 oxidase
MTSETFMMAPYPLQQPPGRIESTFPAGPHQDGGLATAPFAGLYMHIPFCFHKCHYCDFYSIVDSRDRQGWFTEALIAELTNRAADGGLRPETVFVGGGTPTLLRADLWRRLLERMAELGVLDRVREFTVEANPETLSDELLDVLAAGGVNRLSIGAQSFDPALLKTLERWHEPASVERAVSAARRAGIEDVNLDLIFAIPGQTMAGLDADLDRALLLAPTHLACYSLIFEPGTPLARKQQQGRIEPASETHEGAMYERVIDRLDEAGFEQYEISNWARRPKGHERDSYRCRHNLLYWHNANWLGVGPSAASHRSGRRWKNIAHLGAYIAQAPNPTVVDDETLAPDQQIGEQLMLALRTMDGITLDWLDRTLARCAMGWDRPDARARAARAHGDAPAADATGRVRRRPSRSGVIVMAEGSTSLSLALYPAGRADSLCDRGKDSTSPGPTSAIKDQTLDIRHSP